MLADDDPRVHEAAARLRNDGLAEPVVIGRDLGSLADAAHPEADELVAELLRSHPERFDLLLGGQQLLAQGFGPRVCVDERMRISSLGCDWRSACTRSWSRAVCVRRVRGTVRSLDNPSVSD